MGLLQAFGRIFRGFVGDAFPARNPPPLPPQDARQFALDAFADYLADLEFANLGSIKKPTFQIPRELIFTSQAPDPEQLKFPSLVVLPGRGHHDVFALGPPPEDEASMDLHAPGTVLLKLGEYLELFTIEVWGTHDAMRTALLAGIENAMRVGEWSSALLLPMPKYFDRVARFWLDDSEHIDDPDLVRGRVRGRLYIRLEVPEVLLVNAVTLKPYFRLAPVSDPRDP